MPLKSFYRYVLPETSTAGQQHLHCICHATLSKLAPGGMQRLALQIANFGVKPLASADACMKYLPSVQAQAE